MTSSRLPQGGGGRARRARSLRRDARERYRAAAKAASAFADASADKSAARGASIDASTSADASVETSLTGRVRALYEAGIQSSLSHLAATGTGTDCIAVVSLGAERERYCGKHTQLGELIGQAAYTAVGKGIAATFHS